MKRRRFGHTRYGLRSERTPGYDVEPRHAYRDTLVTIAGNPGATRSTLRQWQERRNLHKAVTNRILSIGEQRGHLEVREGRYYITPAGLRAAYP